MTENFGKIDSFSVRRLYSYSYKMLVSVDSFLYFCKCPFLLNIITKKPQRMSYRKIDVTNNINLREYPS